MFLYQIAWVRGVTKNRVEDFARNSSSRRLLKLGLTDGHNEVAAVKYSHITAIPDDVVPGTSVLYVNKLEISLIDHFLDFGCNHWNHWKCCSITLGGDCVKRC